MTKEKKMKTIGRKKPLVKVITLIATKTVAIAKAAWDSDFLAKAVVYSYVLLGFALVIKVLLLGA